MLRVISLILLLSGFLLSSTSIAQSLTVQVERDEVAVNELATLFIVYKGSSSVEMPDLSEFEKLFDVVNIQPKVNIRSYNFKSVAVLEWYVKFFPKKTGKLLIPSLSTGGASSKPLAIKVNPASKNQHFFIETEIDKSPVYIQQQIPVNIKVYYTKAVQNVQMGDSLSMDNVIMEQTQTKNYVEQRDGLEYNVVEYRYFIFPQSSGTIIIPSMSLYFSYYNNGVFQWVRESSEETMIRVKHQPAGFPANATWIPATRLELEDKWMKDPQQFRVGEPITRSITLNAEGLLSSQLPNIMQDTEAEGVKVYPEPPELDDGASQNGILSTRIESAAVILNKSGEVNLPAIRIPWWDVKSDSLKWAELPAKNIKVIGPANKPLEQQSAVNAATPQASPTAAAEDITALQAQLNIWRILAIVFAIATCAFVALWILAQRKAKNPPLVENASLNPSQNKVQQSLRESCQANNLNAVRENVILWAQQQWPKDKITTLQQVSALVKDASLKETIKKLDRSLFSHQDQQEFNANELYAQLMDWQKLNKPQTSTENALQSFYATH